MLARLSVTIHLRTRSIESRFRMIVSPDKLNAKSKKLIFCKQAFWLDRPAYILGNGTIRLTTLTGGGHIADFRLEDPTNASGVNPLWTPPWPTIEPYLYRERIHAQTYGSVVEGKLLSGLAGHNICVDYFGSPSIEEARQGLSQHGEAAWSKWRKSDISVNQRRCALTMWVHLPVSGLNLRRQIELKKDESVAYFTETISNERKVDHFFHWAQHVTLGSPFLSNRDAVISIPGTKGFTSPHGYDEDKALLSSGRVFRWPNAPLRAGGFTDLRSPFLRKGFGFVATVLLNKNKKFGFVAAINRQMKLLITYCFRRDDFPWVAIWEENLGISAPPWERRTRARGLEFSTTPLPVHRRESFTSGRLFGEPNLTFVPARGEKTIRYLALLASVPDGFDNVSDIRLLKDNIQLQGHSRKASIRVKATGVEEFLS